MFFWSCKFDFKENSILIGDNGSEHEANVSNRGVFRRSFLHLWSDRREQEGNADAIFWIVFVRRSLGFLFNLSLVLFPSLLLELQLPGKMWLFATILLVRPSLWDLCLLYSWWRQPLPAVILCSTLTKGNLCRNPFSSEAPVSLSSSTLPCKHTLQLQILLFSIEFYCTVRREKWGLCWLQKMGFFSRVCFHICM